jgi:hypothetical protein
LIRLLEDEGRTLIKQLQASTGGTAEGVSSRYAPWRDKANAAGKQSHPRGRQGRGEKQRDRGSDSGDSSGDSDPGSFDSNELSDGEGEDEDDDVDEEEDDGDRRASGSRTVKGMSAISKRSESRVCVFSLLYTRRELDILFQTSSFTL